MLFFSIVIFKSLFICHVTPGLTSVVRKYSGSNMKAKRDLDGFHKINKINLLGKKQHQHPSKHIFLCSVEQIQVWNDEVRDDENSHSVNYSIK